MARRSTSNGRPNAIAYSIDKDGIVREHAFTVSCGVPSRNMSEADRQRIYDGKASRMLSRLKEDPALADIGADMVLDVRKEKGGLGGALSLTGLVDLSLKKPRTVYQMVNSRTGGDSLKRVEDPSVPASSRRPDCYEFTSPSGEAVRFLPEEVDKAMIYEYLKAYSSPGNEDARSRASSCRLFINPKVYYDARSVSDSRMAAYAVAMDRRGLIDKALSSRESFDGALLEVEERNGVERGYIEAMSYGLGTRETALRRTYPVDEVFGTPDDGCRRQLDDLMRTVMTLSMDVKAFIERRERRKLESAEKAMLVNASMTNVGDGSRRTNVNGINVDRGNGSADDEDDLAEGKGGQPSGSLASEGVTTQDEGAYYRITRQMNALYEDMNDVFMTLYGRPVPYSEEELESFSREVLDGDGLMKLHAGSLSAVDIQKINRVVNTLDVVKDELPRIMEEELLPDSQIRALVKDGRFLSAISSVRGATRPFVLKEPFAVACTCIDELYGYGASRRLVQLLDDKNDRENWNRNAAAVLLERGLSDIRADRKPPRDMLRRHVNRMIVALVDRCEDDARLLADEFRDSSPLVQELMRFNINVPSYNSAGEGHPLSVYDIRTIRDEFSSCDMVLGLDEAYEKALDRYVNSHLALKKVFSDAYEISQNMTGDPVRFFEKSLSRLPEGTLLRFQKQYVQSHGFESKVYLDGQPLALAFDDEGSLVLKGRDCTYGTRVVRQRGRDGKTVDMAVLVGEDGKPVMKSEDGHERPVRVDECVNGDGGRVGAVIGDDGRVEMVRNANIPYSYDIDISTFPFDLLSLNYNIRRYLKEKRFLVDIAPVRETVDRLRADYLAEDDRAEGVQMDDDDRLLVRQLSQYENSARRNAAEAKANIDRILRNIDVQALDACLPHDTDEARRISEEYVNSFAVLGRVIDDIDLMGREDARAIVDDGERTICADAVAVPASRLERVLEEHGRALGPEMAARLRPLLDAKDIRQLIVSFNDIRTSLGDDELKAAYGILDDCRAPLYLAANSHVMDGRCREYASLEDAAEGRKLESPQFERRYLESFIRTCEWVRENRDVEIGDEMNALETAVKEALEDTDGYVTVETGATGSRMLELMDGLIRQYGDQEAKDLLESMDCERKRTDDMLCHEWAAVVDSAYEHAHRSECLEKMTFEIPEERGDLNLVEPGKPYSFEDDFSRGGFYLHEGVYSRTFRDARGNYVAYSFSRNGFFNTGHVQAFVFPSVEAFKDSAIGRRIMSLGDDAKLSGEDVERMKLRLMLSSRDAREADSRHTISFRDGFADEAERMALLRRVSVLERDEAYRDSMDMLQSANVGLVQDYLKEEGGGRLSVGDAGNINSMVSRILDKRRALSLFETAKEKLLVSRGANASEAEFKEKAGLSSAESRRKTSWRDYSLEVRFRRMLDGDSLEGGFGEDAKAPVSTAGMPYGGLLDLRDAVDAFDREYPEIASQMRSLARWDSHVRANGLEDEMKKEGRDTASLASRMVSRALEEYDRRIAQPQEGALNDPYTHFNNMAMLSILRQERSLGLDDGLAGFRRIVSAHLGKDDEILCDDGQMKVGRIRSTSTDRRNVEALVSLANRGVEWTRSYTPFGSPRHSSKSSLLKLVRDVTEGLERTDREYVTLRDDRKILASLERRITSSSSDLRTWHVSPAAKETISSVCDAVRSGRLDHSLIGALAGLDLDGNAGDETMELDDAQHAALVSLSQWAERNGDQVALSDGQVLAFAGFKEPGTDAAAVYVDEDELEVIRDIVDQCSASLAESGGIVDFSVVLDGRHRSLLSGALHDEPASGCGKLMLNPSQRRFLEDFCAHVGEVSLDEADRIILSSVSTKDRSTVLTLEERQALERVAAKDPSLALIADREGILPLSDQLALIQGLGDVLGGMSEEIGRRRGGIRGLDGMMELSGRIRRSMDDGSPFSFTDDDRRLLKSLAAERDAEHSRSYSFDLHDGSDMQRLECMRRLHSLACQMSAGRGEGLTDFRMLGECARQAEVLLGQDLLSGQSFSHLFSWAHGRSGRLEKDEWKDIVSRLEDGGRLKGVYDNWDIILAGLDMQKPGADGRSVEEAIISRIRANDPMVKDEMLEGRALDDNRIYRYSSSSSRLPLTSSLDLSDSAAVSSYIGDGQEIADASWDRSGRGAKERRDFCNRQENMNRVLQRKRKELESVFMPMLGLREALECPASPGGWMALRSVELERGGELGKEDADRLAENSRQLKKVLDDLARTADGYESLMSSVLVSQRLLDRLCAVKSRLDGGAKAKVDAGRAMADAVGEDMLANRVRTLLAGREASQQVSLVRALLDPAEDMGRTASRFSLPLEDVAQVKNFMMTGGMTTTLRDYMSHSSNLQIMNDITSSPMNRVRRDGRTVETFEGIFDRLVRGDECVCMHFPSLESGEKESSSRALESAAGGSSAQAAGIQQLVQLLSDREPALQVAMLSSMFDDKVEVADVVSALGDVDADKAAPLIRQMRNPRSIFAPVKEAVATDGSGCIDEVSMKGLEQFIAASIRKEEKARERIDSQHPLTVDRTDSLSGGFGSYIKASARFAQMGGDMGLCGGRMNVLGEDGRQLIVHLPEGVGMKNVLDILRERYERNEIRSDRTLSSSAFDIANWDVRRISGGETGSFYSVTPLVPQENGLSVRSDMLRVVRMLQDESVLHLDAADRDDARLIKAISSISVVEDGREGEMLLHVDLPSDMSIDDFFARLSAPGSTVGFAMASRAFDRNSWSVERSGNRYTLLPRKNVDEHVLERMKELFSQGSIRFADGTRVFCTNGIQSPDEKEFVRRQFMIGTSAASRDVRARVGEITRGSTYPDYEVMKPVSHGESLVTMAEAIEGRIGAGKAPREEQKSAGERQDRGRVKIARKAARTRE